MITIIQIFSYRIALGFAAAIPGPGMMALVAKTVSGRAKMGFVILLGLILGDLTYLSLAVFGLVGIANHYARFLTLINWGASFYLCVLAWQFWRHKSEAINIEQLTTKPAMFSAGLSGLTITLGNPKTIAFYLSILPIVMPLERVSISIWVTILVPLTMLILLLVDSVFILSPIQVRRLLSSVKAQMLLFRSTAVIMYLAALSIISQTF